MRPHPKLDADFYRKINHQLQTKDRMIRTLQQRLEEIQARVGSRSSDPGSEELEKELADLELQILSQSQSETPAHSSGPPHPEPQVSEAPHRGGNHPEHDAALAFAMEPLLVPAPPAPHVPSPLPTVAPQAPHPLPPPPALAASSSAPIPQRIHARILALRPHLTDPTLDDTEVLHTALRLYDWFLRRVAQGYRVQLVNDEDTTTEVDLIL